MTRSAPFVIGVAGWKNTGKTTLVTRLVAELTRRGYRIATVKHSHHEIRAERPGSDTARHRSAGASAVAVVSPAGWGIVSDGPAFARAPDPEPPLAAVVAALGPADIVIVEGMKHADMPRIETRRRAQGPGLPLADGDRNVFAIATDHEVRDTRTPAFSLDDIGGLADALLIRAALPLHKEPVQ